MRRVLTTIAAIAAITVLAAGCGSDDPITDAQPTPDDSEVDTTGGDDPVDAGDEGDDETSRDDIVLAGALSGFADCATLLDHLRTEGADRVGPWGFENGFYGPVAATADFARSDGVEESLDDSGEGGDAATNAAPSTTVAEYAEGVDFSGTNVQEGGVDEADIVKTDGDRIFIVASGQLVVVDVETRTVAGTVDVPEGDRAELFISGDDVLLVQQTWGDPATDYAADNGRAAVDSIWVSDAGSTTVTRISVAGDTPEVLDTLRAEGDYVSARAVDGTARIIIRSNPQYRFPFVYPQGESGEERAEEANREALLGSELEDWLPGYTLTNAAGAEMSGLLAQCEQVHAPEEFAGFGVVSVLTVDVDGSIDPSATSAVLAPGDVVYASPESVYVATTAWPDVLPLAIIDDDSGQNEPEPVTTSIHRFDITSDSSAAYTASGSVEGVIRDSYSLSEHEGHLRVVTTTGEVWGENSESFVRVVREQDGELVEVGSVGDMGNGEAVQSVRFQGDVGYVVTFRQVDPLYTLDLSNPENPIVRGELKIPGFSSYLHPIGDGRVLGIGSEADETNGRVTGAKVSLFDVNDLTSPREIATWTVPNGSNEIGWDPHAFLWWAPENLAVVPMQLWDQGNQWAGAILLRVEGNTISEVGRIDHVDPNANLGETECEVITQDALPSTDQSQFETELEYMITEGGALVLDCAEGQARSATGYECHTEDFFGEEAARIGVDVDGTLVTCWQAGNGVPPISRSMVLPGDELWTVSSTYGYLGGSEPVRLQVNDLVGFDRLDAVTL